ncbi:MAG: response regulator transcription factor [Bdellovibrionales bacterium]
MDICASMKKDEELKSIPVIFVTAKGEEKDIVRGLEMGADDYLTKPFSPQVLIARVKALLRRTYEGMGESDDKESIELGLLKIHKGRHEVTIADESVKLTNTEFQILTFLTQKPGWVYTRGQIVNAIHGQDYAVTDRTIDFQMVGLRKKLGSVGQYIETVRGVGYRFKDE